MDKRLQALILLFTFSLCATARLSMLGWLGFYAIAYVTLFGLIHFIIHFYCLNNLAEQNRKNWATIIISQTLFAFTFLLQTDFDDSRSYSVLSHYLGFESDLLENYGLMLAGITLLLYILHSTWMVRSVRRRRLPGKNLALIVISFLLAPVMPYLVTYGAYSYEVYVDKRDVEAQGGFTSIERALECPDQVDSLTVLDGIYVGFPIKVFQLSPLTYLNLKGHEIPTIPDDIATLKNLQSLNLLDNPLTEINPALCECTNLVELRLGGEITEIPDCLKQMKNLRHFSLQSHKINDLLDELRDFEYLETAHFSIYTNWAAYQLMTREEKAEYFRNTPAFDNQKWQQIMKDTGISHKD